MEIKNLDERTARVVLRRRGVETDLADIRSRTEMVHQLITTGKIALQPTMITTPIAELTVATGEVPEV